MFLAEKRITGIKLELDNTTRVLVAVSAIIPIFGFPEWEWDQISEVLIYPDRFDNDFAFESDSERHTLGMVGTGALNRLMILSKPDLLDGFRNQAGVVVAGGRDSRTLNPPPAKFSAVTLPPIDSTSPRTRAKPMPVPLAVRVNSDSPRKKGSKTFPT